MSSSSLVRNASLVISALCLTITLTACSQEPIDGVVIDKRIREAYDYTYYQPIYVTQCSGNPMVCTSVWNGITIPITTHYPECRELVVQTEKKKREKCVDSITYERVQIGQHYREPDR